MKFFAAFLIALVLAGSLGAAPAQAATCGNTYIVSLGDTLYSIAEKCGLRYVVLININYELSDPGKIYPGQVIRLTAEEPLSYYTQPVSGPDQPYGLQPDGVYIVRKGDSLARIAYLYGTTLYELYQANPELGGRPNVYAGQAIRLPTDARRRKGWVGVSNLGPAVSSTIVARVVDFPSYASITYRLHQVTVEEGYRDTKTAGPEDIVRTDSASLYIEGTTDARGSARTTIKLPTTAKLGKTWVVDVFTDNAGDGEYLARSPVMTIGGVKITQ
jgi:LysM repeat protein